MPDPNTMSPKAKKLWSQYLEEKAKQDDNPEGGPENVDTGKAKRLWNRFNKETGGKYDQNPSTGPISESEANYWMKKPKDERPFAGLTSRGSDRNR